MNSEDVKNMTDEEINVAIAETCGWEHYRDWDEPNFKAPSGEFFHSRPRYTSDLNAMHEAEESLTDRQHRFFRGHLYGSGMNDRRICSATARQRAEAFLLVVKGSDASKS